jgi:hypothetical protein
MEPIRLMSHRPVLTVIVLSAYAAAVTICMWAVCSIVFALFA